MASPNRFATLRSTSGSSISPSTLRTSPSSLASSGSPSLQPGPALSRALSQPAFVPRSNNARQTLSSSLTVLSGAWDHLSRGRVELFEKQAERAVERGAMVYLGVSERFREEERKRHESNREKGEHMDTALPYEFEGKADPGTVFKLQGVLFDLQLWITSLEGEKDKLGLVVQQWDKLSGGFRDLNAKLRSCVTFYELPPTTQDMAEWDSQDASDLSSDLSVLPRLLPKFKPYSPLSAHFDKGFKSLNLSVTPLSSPTKPSASNSSIPSSPLISPSTPPTTPPSATATSSSAGPSLPPTPASAQSFSTASLPPTPTPSRNVIFLEWCYRLNPSIRPTPATPSTLSIPVPDLPPPPPKATPIRAATLGATAGKRIVSASDGMSDGERKFRNVMAELGKEGGAIGEKARKEAVEEAGRRGGLGKDGIRRNFTAPIPAVAAVTAGEETETEVQDKSPASPTPKKGLKLDVDGLPKASAKRRSRADEVVPPVPPLPPLFSPKAEKEQIVFEEPEAEAEADDRVAKEAETVKEQVTDAPEIVVEQVAAEATAPEPISHSPVDQAAAVPTTTPTETNGPSDAPADVAAGPIETAPAATAETTVAPAPAEEPVPAPLAKDEAADTVSDLPPSSPEVAQSASDLARSQSADPRLGSSSLAELAAAPPRAVTPPAPKPRPIRVLSIDGGGVRGLSALLLLRKLMDQLQRRLGLRTLPRPCEYFDLIAGTGTGGLIALLVGRLKLGVDEAIQRYVEMATSVFGKEKGVLAVLLGKERFSAKKLEQSIRDAVLRVTQDDNAPMRDEGSACRTFVLAVHQNAAAGVPRRIRTYATRRELERGPSTGEGERVAIWQAARATSAAPTFFKPITVEDLEMTFVDAGLAYNNPSEQAVEEAREIWPASREGDGRQIGCFVSIGTGRQRGGKTRVAKACAEISASCEGVARKVEGRFRSGHGRGGIEGAGAYFRLNVGEGLEETGIEEWDRPTAVKEATEVYADGGEIVEKLERAVGVLVDLADESKWFAPPEPLPRTAAPIANAQHASTVSHSSNSNGASRRTPLAPSTFTTPPSKSSPYLSATYSAPPKKLNFEGGDFDDFADMYQPRASMSVDNLGRQQLQFGGSSASLHHRA